MRGCPCPVACGDGLNRFQDGVVEDDILKDMKSLKALSTPQLTALVSMSLDFLTSTDGAYVRGGRRHACMHAPRGARAVRTRRRVMLAGMEWLWLWLLSVLCWCGMLCF